MDFPMPGSPPTKTREPRTIPPPRTRSSSLILVLFLLSPDISIAESGRGDGASLRARPLPFAPFSAAGSSANVFHSRHPGHWPIHFEDSYPQLLQKKMLPFPFAIFALP